MNSVLEVTRPEIFANFPVVQEQGVVGSLPPVEEFTAYVARRPSPLVEVRPSVRVQRHVVEHLADIAPMVQILDSPEPADGGTASRGLPSFGHAVAG